MHRLLLLFFSCALLAQRPAPFTDHGTFRVSSAGQLLGTERFDIETLSDAYRARGEIKLKMPGSGEASESATLNVSGALQPFSYTRIQKAPKKASVEVVFRQGQVHAHYEAGKGPTDYEYYLDPNVVVLDTNFFHHFAFLVLRYDMKKGGPQQMTVFIPQEASPGTMLVEYVGKDEGRDKFTAKTDALEIQIWCGADRHILKMAVPSAHVEIVREEK